MKNQTKVNTAQLRREINAEINSARIISSKKVALSTFDRKSLKMVKSEVSEFDQSLMRLLSNRGGYRVLSLR